MREKFCLLVSIVIYTTLAAQKQDVDGDTLSLAGLSEPKTVQLEKTVVTATRLEVPLREIASSVSIINGSDIEKQQDRMVTDVLRDVPGLTVVENGGIGRLTNVYMRGANPEHTMVLVDGVEMNDPMSMGRSYNFADLAADNIDRIEIIRGPQSTLYGSDAIGGVINILTKRGNGRPSFYVTGEGGSHRTFRETLGMQGSWNVADYSLSLSRMDTEGFSAAGESYGNLEEDGYHNTTLSARLGLHPRENLDFDAVARFIDSDSDIDYGGGINGDDPNNTVHLTQVTNKIMGKLALFNNLWEQKVEVSFTNLDRNNINGSDTYRPDDTTYSTFDGQMFKVNWQNNLYVHRTNTLTGGVEFEQESGKSYSYFGSLFGSSKITNLRSAMIAGYFQDHVSLWDCFFTTVGIRGDYNRDFGEKVTFRCASTGIVKPVNTKIKATVGTGFKAPSLYQLYSEYGDSALESENSIGWDVGIEQSFWKEKIKVGATYFNNNFDNLIQFDLGTWTYDNVAKAATQGVEVISSLQPIDDISVSVNYTYLETRDKDTKEPLLYRPKHTINGSVQYTILDRAVIGIAGTHVGKREGYDEVTGGRIKMSDYQLLNLSVSYAVTDHLSLFSRVHNVLGEEYEEVRGYGTAGTTGHAGFQLSF